MSISDKDKKLMKDVAAFFLATKSNSYPNGSINETALKFGITRTKVTKMLVTEGVYTSPMVSSVQRLREQGMSVKEIAAQLSVSTGTVSSYLPYTDEFHGTAEPSKHVAEVREYRAYEKEQKKRQKDLKVQTSRGDQPEKEDQSGKGEKNSWEKEKAMSYQVDWTRPPRVTWENIADMMPADKIEELNEHMALRKERDNRERAELAKLQAVESPTEDQKQEMKDLINDLGMYPGALNFRNKFDLERISGNRLPFEPQEVVRLHLELVDWIGEKELDVLRKYGNVKGDTISRDIVVPFNIPLYALHYVIQRAFGWQNSHLHDFHLTDERLSEFCEDSPEKWQKMVGIIFRSPYMDEDAQFWAEDYEGGSFKNWLRRKYTGPYLSQCREEGLYSSFYDVQNIEPETEMYVSYSKIPRAKMPYDGKDKEYIESPYFAGWVKNGESRAKPDERVEIVKFKDFPLDRLYSVFGTDPFTLLERLPLESILCPGFDRLPSVFSASVEKNYTSDTFTPASEESAENEKKVGTEEKTDVVGEEGNKEIEEEIDDEARFIEENTCKTVTEELSFIDDSIDAAFRLNEDSPFNQVLPMPFATELIYRYDFGDGWKVRITASFDCRDMDVSQDILDKANIKCRETYRPVMIARDGEMVMDDVGGLSGFAGFLLSINPDLDNMNKAQKVRARKEKKEFLIWAKGQGWKKNDASDLNLL